MTKVNVNLTGKIVTIDTNAPEAFVRSITALVSVEKQKFTMSAGWARGGEPLEVSRDFDKKAVAMIKNVRAGVLKLLNQYFPEK
mgnify:CR=1 FL=1